MMAEMYVRIHKVNSRSFVASRLPPLLSRCCRCLCRPIGSSLFLEPLAWSAYFDACGTCRRPVSSADNDALPLRTSIDPNSLCPPLPVAMFSARIDRTARQCCECTCDPSNGDDDNVCTKFSCIDPSAACVDDDDITADMLENCGDVSGTRRRNCHRGLFTLQRKRTAPTGKPSAVYGCSMVCEIHACHLARAHTVVGLVLRLRLLDQTHTLHARFKRGKFRPLSSLVSFTDMSIAGGEYWRWLLQPGQQQR